MESHPVTAWEILLENSTAPVGSTAWVHLSSQEGGGGQGEPFPVDDLQIDIISEDLVVDFIDDMVIALIEDTLTLDIDDSRINTNITNNGVDTDIY